LKLILAICYNNLKVNNFHSPRLSFYANAKRDAN